ncbi:MAG: hypothetical protein JKY93_06100 [Gammaproteobacteria bacterium]|nr:hypothetical protein [Gammaproteobacteria bacterium]
MKTKLLTAISILSAFTTLPILADTGDRIDRRLDRKGHKIDRCMDNSGQRTHQRIDRKHANANGNRVKR